MTDALEPILGLAIIVLVATWLLRRVAWIRLRTADPKTAVEEARSMGAGLAWDELNLDRLDRKGSFRRHVERLSRPDVPFEELAQMAQSGTPGIAALGLSAIARRDDVPEKWTSDAIRSITTAPFTVEPFIYRTLLETATQPVIGPALGKLGDETDWDALARFIQQRRAGGEDVGVETFRGNVPAGLADDVRLFIDRFETYLGDDFRGYFDEWRRTAVDLEFLRHVGRILQPPYDDPPAFLAGRREELVEVIVDALAEQPRRSVLLVGEHGVGKTALLRAALERLPSNLVPFEATATEISAGAMYVGELEGRIQELAGRLRGHPVVWLFPGFSQALYSGQHSRSPMGMLDAMLPHIERRELTVVGEIDPPAFERLLAERPRVAGAFEIVRVRPLDEGTTVAVAEHMLAGRASRETLLESYELAQQFVPGVAPPGNLLRLVKATAAEVEEEGRKDFETSDVLATLAASSGLPLAMLDPNAPLELEQVRVFFEARVLAQPEAVETVVERIAMIKAGLNDATRPLGVFLFIGPTGTGKTEIAKALAEYLFGSQRRLVRLDMSEYQTPDSLERLLADPSVEGRGTALLASVRKDPFAVVLLDEFEKAAAPIWDLFLQVFDDGRLTDQQGRTADFRRCIIILTSNVGSALAHRPGVGFKAEHGRFRTELIEDELKRTFRPEFLNRIDRVVIFRPFAREQMRALLDKELADALERRGLRTRPWAVELDESAVEFLIEQGFSPDLGARPLKRALDRHLLAPLARQIVEHAVPEGDQFLFVTAGDEGLDVRFIDPDAPVDREPDADARVAEARDVRALALGAGQDEEAVSFLRDELARIRSAVEGELQARKDAALAAMQRPEFWEEDDRHEVLAEAEYLDRLQAAFATASKLGDRLAQHGGGRNGAGQLAQLLAVRLHVLQAAIDGLADDHPADVFLAVARAGGDDTAEGRRWEDDVATMYEAWARRRGMRLERLERTGHVYAVSGLGAGTILQPEAGIHVLEVADEEREGERFERHHALVLVAPWRHRPDVGAEGLLRQARAVLQAPAEPEIVRRYRAKPTPLVRDAVRGYRTGRLDRVLAGDFDLF
ncbi:MAG TPA: AAA family ATPase [Gaiellaceae bacterium]|nr:AAA family ATPase [Gaiellaceae bacterium]